MAFYDAYAKAKGGSLHDVYEKYTPPIRSKKHTCVGLGLELMKRWRGLEKDFPGMCEATALLSCEEAVVEVKEYVSWGPEQVAGAEKEHVLAGVRVTIDGRPGLMLADPGYHVSRVITVMMDRAYPHTGWFTQSDESQCRKEYNYVYNPVNPDYVEWQERVSRVGVVGGSGGVKCQTSLVYVARPYLDGVHVTERRNLVYNFRSLLSRDQKGHLVAGIYFPVDARGKETQFTLFFDSGNEIRKTKYKFSTFTDPKAIPEAALEEIQVCNALMNYKKNELRYIILKLAKIMSTQPFIDQLLEINEDICRMSL